MRTFCHDLARSIPNITRINRGKLSLTEVAEKALENHADRVIIVDRWKGGPGKIRFFHVEPAGLKAVPPVIYVKGIRLQRDFRKTRIKPVRSLAVIKPSENTDEASVMADFLSDFLHVPMLSLEEASTSCQAAILVSLDPMQRMRTSFFLLPEKVEIGPQITFSHVIWEIWKNESSRGCSVEVSLRESFRRGF
jgi:rRNA maturation protein Rpf1